MNKSFLGVGALVVVIGILIVGGASIFTVHQTQQALVLRFGQPVGSRAVVTQPGLHFKAPFIENVVYFDNRILDLEQPRQEVLAADNSRIEVDSFLRYRIVDPLRFYQSVRSIEGGNNQLGSVLNSAVRRVLGEASMMQIVREDRASLMQRINDQVNTEAIKLGANVIDVRIRRADLPRQISEQVFLRMQTERQREASEFRAQGAEQKQRIESRADRDVTVLRAEAQRQADQTRGEGDALRNKIFAEAFGRDPNFFAFWRSMQAYEAGLRSQDTRFIISPTSEFFRFFNQSSGLKPPPAGAAPAPAAPPAARPSGASGAFAPLPTAPATQTRAEN
jgi:membrane protease subunit HflC